MASLWRRAWKARRVQVSKEKNNDSVFNDLLSYLNGLAAASRALENGQIQGLYDRTASKETGHSASPQTWRHGTPHMPDHMEAHPPIRRQDTPHMLNHMEAHPPIRRQDTPHMLDHMEAHPPMRRQDAPHMLDHMEAHPPIRRQDTPHTPQMCGNTPTLEHTQEHPPIGGHNTPHPPHTPQMCGMWGGIPHVLQRMKSTIPGAGDGCFLTRGHVKSGGVLTLYPGLALPTDALPSMWLKYSDDAFDAVPPLFLVGNSYLLRVRCGGQDWMMDGRPVGLSAARFRAAIDLACDAGRVPANTAWLDVGAGDDRNGLHETLQSTCGLHGTLQTTCRLRETLQSTCCSQQLLGQAAMGHLINHPPVGVPPNVEFDAIVLPAGLPRDLLRIIPSLPDVATCGARVPRVVVMIRALTEMQVSPGDEAVELFMDYGTDPHRIGYH